jgi:hypothetical protein
VVFLAAGLQSIANQTATGLSAPCLASTAFAGGVLARILDRNLDRRRGDVMAEAAEK